MATKLRALFFRIACCVFLGTAGPACGDDDASVEGGDGQDAGETGIDFEPGTTGGADDDGDAGESTGTVEELDPCVACFDDNPCTEDLCNAGMCSWMAVVSNDCRPQIDVVYPPRGSTLLGAWDDPMVDVIGTATSEAAPIASLTINGEEVEVGGYGEFVHRVPAAPGGNMLLIETVDALGASRRRVQSFLWSTDYRDPTSVPVGMVPGGMAIYLAQDSLDDGDRSLPADDMATLLEMALGTFDLGELIDPQTPLTHSAGYDIYLTDLSLGSTEVSVQARDGGLYLSAGLLNVLGDLDFDCTNFGCVLSGGDSSGGLTIDYVGITADLVLTVNDNHEVVVDVQNVQVDRDPDDVEIWSNNWWTDFLIMVVEPFIMNGVVADITESLESQVESMLGPALGSAFGGLSFDTTLSMPALVNGSAPISVRLVTDFQATDFHDGSARPQPSPPRGGLFLQRAGGYAFETRTPHVNSGVPMRDGCGSATQALSLPRDASLEIGLSDDLINELLHAAWRGGILEFPVTPDTLGGGTGGFISNLQMTASGMLAPTASDCNQSSELLLHIGDMELVASLDFLDQPMTFTAYTSMVAELDISVGPGGTVGLAVAEVRDVQTEVTVHEDENIVAEDALRGALENQLIDVLLERLGNEGAFGIVELPAFDLSDELGLPDGTAVISVEPENSVRIDGATVIQGHL